MHLHLPSLAIGALIGFLIGYYFLRWVTMVKTDAHLLTAEFKLGVGKVETEAEEAVADMKADVGEKPPSIPSTKT